METYEDRVRDFCPMWNQLFAFLDFRNIDDFEDTYRGQHSTESS